MLGLLSDTFQIELQVYQPFLDYIYHYVLILFGFVILVNSILLLILTI